jgi:hypothetical protein
MQFIRSKVSSIHDAKYNRTFIISLTKVKYLKKIIDTTYIKLWPILHSVRQILSLVSLCYPCDQLELKNNKV